MNENKLGNIGTGIHVFDACRGVGPISGPNDRDHQYPV
jgi:hypothetical protein